MTDMKPLSAEDVTMILSGLIKVALARRGAEGLAPDTVMPEEELSNRIKQSSLYIRDAAAPRH